MSNEKKEAREARTGEWLTKRIEDAKARNTNIDEKRKEIIDLKYRKRAAGE